jgi:hypothetical protein
MKFDFKPRLTTVSYADLCGQLRKCSKKLGEGAFAKVFQHPTKKTRVLKVNKCDEQVTSDGYYAYVRRISKLRRHNPFLPRVCSIKVFKRALRNDPYDRSYEWYFVAELEKLVPHTKLKRSNRITWYWDHIDPKMQRPNLNNDDWYIDEVELYTRPHPRVKLTALKQANNIIKRLSKQRYPGGRFFHDDQIHNMMWRVRASGMHPVYTDPIA